MATSAGSRPSASPGPGPGVTFLEVEHLSVEFPSAEGAHVAVDDVSFRLPAGFRLGLVGESGSGKTLTVSALMGMVPSGARATGRVNFEGRDILSLPAAKLREVRGSQIALVPQDPAAALSPVRRVGTQMIETLCAHRDLDRATARELSLEALASVRVPSPRRQLAAYPFELSGGMLQRICIAMALMCEPELLIADEATTALDVSVQASILELLDQVAAERAMALIVVSHDMSVVAGLCDQTAVMYAGRIVETGSTTQLFSAPRHPYTAALVECRPSIAADARYTFLTSIPGQLGPTDNVGNQCAFAPRCRFAIDRCTSERPPVGPVGADEGHLAACWRSQEALDFLHQVRRDTGLLPSAEVATTPLLEARDLEVHYPVRLPGTLRPVPVKAVDGVSLAVKAGTTLGVVGESGCGKSTVGRAVLGLQRLTRGSVHFAGQDLSRLDRATMRVMRRRMQLVVQSSFNSFDPRVPLGQAIAEAVRLTPEGRQGTAARVHELLDLVELPTRIASALPADVSGGQRQRASIARALSTRPDLIVADEPTSALDVSVRAGILNLLRGLQRDHQVSYIFISHDLAAVRSMSDEVAVMYFGHIVERGPADEVFERPAHPYTRALLDAVPGLGADETQQPAPIPGEVPSLLEPPPGCPFHPRCPRATDECRLARPALLPVRPGHEAACIHPIEGAREAGL